LLPVLHADTASTVLSAAQRTTRKLISASPLGRLETRDQIAAGRLWEHGKVFPNGTSPERDNQATDRTLRRQSRAVDVAGIVAIVHRPPAGLAVVVLVVAVGVLMSLLAAGLRAAAARITTAGVMA
jgi:hypothetical protein